MPSRDTAYESTLEAFRSAGDNRGMAVALNGLGDVAAAQDDFENARRLYEESLMQFQQIGDPWGVAGVLRDLGVWPTVAAIIAVLRIFTKKLSPSFTN